MSTHRRINQIQRILRKRELIYFGPRGIDASPLTCFDSLGAVFSLIAPIESGVAETCLESATGVRMDLNRGTLDDNPSTLAVRFREALFARLSRPNAVIPYSPVRTLSHGRLTAKDTSLPLGLFHEQQSCFDHKPWVEQELGKCGLATIPWEYVGTLESSRVFDLLDQGAPFVVRMPQSRGGSSIWLIRNRDDMDDIFELEPREGLFCLAPYFESATSVNINACVFRGGEVSVHPSSVQLVGVDVCTSRTLGYAGNDFASISEISKKALKCLDSMTHSIGAWLANRGYRGAFGFDALVLGDRVMFVELNPRFQASSATACQLDRTIERTDQYVNHISAFLELGAPDRLSLLELVREQEPLSHIVVYNKRSEAVALHQRPKLGTKSSIQLLPAPGIVVEYQGILASILWKGGVSRNGRDFDEDAGSAVLELLQGFSPVGAEKDIKQTTISS